MERVKRSVSEIGGSRSAGRADLAFIYGNVAAFLLAAYPSGNSFTSFLLTAGAGFVAVLLTLILLHNHNVPTKATALGSVYLISLMALRHEQPGNPWSESLIFLAVMCVAFEGKTVHLWVISTLAGLTFLAPRFIYPEENYPPEEWKKAVLHMALSLAIGGSIQALVRTVRTRSENMGALTAAARAAVKGDDPREAICTAAEEIFSAQKVVIMEPMGHDTIRGTAGSKSVRLDRLAVNPSKEISACAEVLATGQRLHPKTSAELQTVSPKMNEVTKASSAIFQPIWKNGQAAAVLVLCFTKPTKELTSDQVEMLEMLAVEAGKALERADLLQKLRDQATKDPLTGAANRRAWGETLGEHLSEETEDAPVSVLLLDLDHFKRFNDTFGHAVGDELLKELVTAVKAELRDCDTLARWGGEEFSIVLPGCNVQKALQVADRIREVIPREQTCSIGVVEHYKGEETSAMFRRADAALYKAKKEGRNRAVAAN